jgi:hypothetical protein
MNAGNRHSKTSQVQRCSIVRTPGQEVVTGTTAKRTRKRNKNHGWPFFIAAKPGYRQLDAGLHDGLASVDDGMVINPEANLYPFQ